MFNSEYAEPRTNEDLERENAELKKENAKLKKHVEESRSRFSQGVPSKQIEDIQEKSHSSQKLG